uniref:Cytochrome P450 n=1 Tax=Chironomus tentans TaxID=7153 RepID=A0A1W6R7W4_CHITE|nr:cytochrome P450 [Chironomus tentans]
MLIYLLLLILSYFAYKWITRNNDYFEGKGIPYAKPMFLMGSNNIFTNKRSLPECVINWHNQFKNDKVSGFFEFLKPIFIVRDPQLIKQLTVKDFDSFSDHRVFITEDIDVLFGKALISLQGQKWKDMRSTLSPAFTGMKMRLMFDFVATVGKQTASTLRQKIISGGEKNFEFKELATKFTVDNIASCSFGIDINSFENPDNDFHEIAKEFLNFSKFSNVLKFVGFVMAPAFMKLFDIKFFSNKLVKFFHEATIDTMKIREQKGIVRHDMINLLMQAKKGKLVHENNTEEIADGFATVEEYEMEKSSAKRKWDDLDLVAQCFIFFLAGFDTVATAMTFMAYELVANQDIQQKLYEEIAQVEEELEGGMLTYERIQSMKYMDQVVSEALRKWPPAPVTDRICTKDYQVSYDDKKFIIEKGISFLIPIWGIHNDPRYFPNPEKFDPERFSDENKKNIQDSTYLPFGSGNRNCIGSRFALMEMKTVFYYLLLNFKFAVTEKTKIPLAFNKIPVGIKIENGVWIGLEPR